MSISHSLSPAQPPVLTAADAVAQLRAIASHPPRHETLVLALDAQHLCTLAFTVAGARTNHEVIHVGQMLAAVARERPITSAVFAVVRPAGGFQFSDEDLWYQLEQACDEGCIAFIDLFILADDEVSSVGQTAGITPCSSCAAALRAASVAPVSSVNSLRAGGAATRDYSHEPRQR